MMTSTPVFLNTLLYAGVGILVFVVGFFILDMLTPA
jgi:putative membrane protein